LLVAPPSGSNLVRWDESRPIGIDERDLAGQPESAALFGEVPATINTAKKLAALRSDLAEYLYRNLTYPLLYSPTLKVYSEPAEDERAFKIRLQQAAREQRDDEVDKLQAKYQTKLDSLQEKLRREEIELQKDESAYNARKQQEMLSAGDSLLSFFGGRKRVTTALSSASQKRQMTERAKQEVLESQETIAQLNQQMQELQAEMDSISREAATRWDQAQHEIEPYPVRPRKSDVDIQHLAVAWTPQWLVTISDAGGQARTETVSAL
jgi:molecular chaperone GrpE (heat shock protein)